MGTLLDIIVKLTLLGLVAIVAMIAWVIGAALLSAKYIMYGLGVLLVAFLICRLILKEDFSKDTARLFIFMLAALFIGAIYYGLSS